MKTSARYIVSVGAAALLASCGGPEPPLSASVADYSRLGQPLTIYKVIYNFHRKPGGEHPEARLTPVHGVLYGTTSAGGKGCKALNGCGTVFKMTNERDETLLYRFKGIPDGADPLAEVTAVGKDLYGTTYVGGEQCNTHMLNYGCGTVFVIGPSGERVLYRFPGIPDGARPQGSLIFENGTLYGTTTEGGVQCSRRQRIGCGTVYSIDRFGNERILHRFTGNPDGETPTGNLVMVNGTLYGTTSAGGTSNLGAVFAITPRGSESILYSSQGLNDMIGPSGLIAVGNILYGSSYRGGTRGGGGTVYSVTTSGSERILHNFNLRAPHDGIFPSGRLVGVNTTLYGTTSGGGHGLGSGLGILYALNIVSGKFTVLYRFKGTPDGSRPEAGVSDALGTLYGTTVTGGTGCHYQSCQDGYGTVFRLTI